MNIESTLSLLTTFGKPTRQARRVYGRLIEDISLVYNSRVLVATFADGYLGRVQVRPVRSDDTLAFDHAIFSEYQSLESALIHLTTVAGSFWCGTGIQVCSFTVFEDVPTSPARACFYIYRETSGPLAAWETKDSEAISLAHAYVQNPECQAQLGALKDWLKEYAPEEVACQLNEQEPLV